MSSVLAAAVAAGRLDLVDHLLGRSGVGARAVGAPPTSFTTTFAPSAASSSASARPMPRPAPVTSATLPSKLPNGEPPGVDDA